ncbi:AAA family ATPase [Myxococcota bacterium]|nr:AAA family ATPase [Myxococcota bacterium]MBU1432198.1 AAA family ATPase [Myxococcota bacterium]MBU1900190.1 AAA family ATPase [Myxococcota bacterium]
MPQKRRVIALINQKGGSGKTTSTVNLAAALGAAGQRVLVIDLDPQGSASAWLGVDSQEPALFDVFAEARDLKSVIVPTQTPGVGLAPASPHLVGVERLLSSEPGAELILKEALKSVRRQYDFILLDCAPSLSVLSISALVAADEVLIPVEASTMALAGLAQLMKTIERVKARLNTKLKIAGILLCRADRTNLAMEVEASLRKNFKRLVFEQTVPENVRVREAWGHKTPVIHYAKSSKSALAYMAVAEAMLSR